MGSGFFGDFGATTGSKNDEIPIKKPGDLRYSKKKTEMYLLNTEHPKGGSKAKFMKEVLGYEVSDSKLFHKNVIASVIGKTPFKTSVTEFGIKHEYHTKLIGKNGKSVSANVTVVIQKDNGRKTYKIITAFPRKKDE